MREISCREIAKAIEELCIRAAVWLPADVAMQLECASESEWNEAGRAALNDIVENYRYAAEKNIPICQDTGMAVVFAEIGQEVHITDGCFEDAINEGVGKGYVNGYLRKSVVEDPLRRVNTNDNTPAVIHTRLVPGDKLKLMVAPKGFGSENMSRMKMFLPSCTQQQIVDFVAESVTVAGARPCPPVIIGVGLGGTVEKAALLAKQALCRPIDTRNSDDFYADMEAKCLQAVNASGIGAQGFGGETTALAVNIEVYPTHIAGLPCVVNMGCHATRHASCEL
ncbi:MAG: fumarate hydratase [Oscillospiraceae bacterium]|nr:fumarate hydratase [Oscillospiraceae bacterium]